MYGIMPEPFKSWEIKIKQPIAQNKYGIYRLL